MRVRRRLDAISKARHSCPETNVRSPLVYGRSGDRLVGTHYTRVMYVFLPHVADSPAPRHGRDSVTVSSPAVDRPSLRARCVRKLWSTPASPRGAQSHGCVRRPLVSVLIPSDMQVLTVTGVRECSGDRRETRPRVPEFARSEVALQPECPLRQGAGRRIAR